MHEIFISYRRDDSDATVGRIYDRLKDRFGTEAIFRDKNAIPYGREFPERIQQALEQAVAMLVIIGPSWLSALDQYEKRRLDIPEDWVRQEVATALKRGIVVIPVVVQGAKMPDRRGLPRVLAKLADHNALPVRTDPDFDDDMKRLIAALPPSLTPLPAADAAVAIRGDADDCFVTGQAFSDRDEYAKAIPYLTLAAQRDPRNPVVLDYLADAYHEEGRLDDALAAYRRWAALDTGDERPLRFAAATLAELGRFAEALEAYNTTVAANPQEWEPWKSKADLLRELGRDAEAWEADQMANVLLSQRRAHTLGDVEGSINRAKTLFSLDVAKQALDECNRAVAAHPGDPRVWRLMAHVLRVLGGRTREAEEAERKAQALGG